MEIFFHTENSVPSTGWSLSWGAVTPGEKALMLNSIGIVIDWNMISSPINMVNGDYEDLIFLVSHCFAFTFQPTVFHKLEFTLSRIKSLHQVQSALPQSLPLLANPAISSLEPWTATTRTSLTTMGWLATAAAASVTLT